MLADSDRSLKASSYVSLLIIMSAVFLLVSAQFSTTLAELRYSRMNEKYSGLYDIGVSVAQAKSKEINKRISDLETDILREYMELYDWINVCKLTEGSLILTGEAFYKDYQKIAVKYMGPPGKGSIHLTHCSGLEINIETNTNFGALGVPFTITATNNSQRAAALDAPSKITIEGHFIWNPDPPVYRLEPFFNINEETINEKSFSDFSVTNDTNFSPVVITNLFRS